MVDIYIQNSQGLEDVIMQIDREDLCGYKIEGGSAYSNVIFRDQNLQGSSFTNTCLEKTSFVRCDMRGCTFHDSKLSLSRFKNCNLNGSIFSSCDMREMEIIACEMDGVDIAYNQLGNTTLNNVSLHGAMIYTRTRFEHRNELTETLFGNAPTPVPYSYWYDNDMSAIYLLAAAYDVEVCYPKLTHLPPLVQPMAAAWQMLWDAGMMKKPDGPTVWPAK